jgi:hypothetical protein
MSHPRRARTWARCSRESGLLGGGGAAAAEGGTPASGHWDALASISLQGKKGGEIEEQGHRVLMYFNIIISHQR